MAIKKWDMLHGDGAAAQRLARETDLSPLACEILAARGLTGTDELTQFFCGELADPFLLPDMQAAVERIHAAVDGGERICVYGDYDCDGITSTVLLFTYLRDLGANVEYYIPDRDSEGYGMNVEAVRLLAQRGVGLIITVDNGVSALEEIALAGELHVDVVVTDHHKPRETLPSAVAVVDPHRADCTAPFRPLAGVGVAFKLICALEGGGGAELLECMGELVCIGTVADVVPLTGENRVIVRRGLECLQYTENVGLRALLEEAGVLDKRLTCENVAFILAPRLNAAGRLGQVQKAVDLLLCEDEDEARALAQEITELNRERQSLENAILKDISDSLQKDPALAYERVLVLSGSGWHHGVVGIVCSRLVERYGKPCLLISVDGDEARGSGRAVEGYSLVDAISRCSQHLTRYGGHAQAAGFSLRAQDIGAFRQALLEDAAREHADMPYPAVRVDYTAKPGELTLESVRSLAALEPFGAGNEAPVYALLSVRVEGIYAVGATGAHLRLRLSHGGAPVTAMYFSMTTERFPYKTGDTVDVAVACNVNEYNGEERLSFQIRAIRPAGVEQEALLEGARLYDRCRRREPLAEGQREKALPVREDIAAVYRFLRDSGGYIGEPEVLYSRLGGVGYCKLCLALDVMEELGLITRAAAKSGMALTLCPVAGKVDLTQSGILRCL